MIKDGFMYITALISIAALLVYLPKIFKGKTAQKIFKFAPPIVLIYLGLMLLCTKRSSYEYNSIKRMRQNSFEF